jgi:hypothetical protein
LDFLDECTKAVRDKFQGAFAAVAEMGESYVNQQRFWPLHRKGRPLWEFKEHDHRLYCSREVQRDRSVEIVCFHGWVKQKKGKTRQEDTEIDKALALHGEHMAVLQRREREKQ